MLTAMIDAWMNGYVLLVCCLLLLSAAPLLCCGPNQLSFFVYGTRFATTTTAALKHEILDSHGDVRKCLQLSPSVNVIQTLQPVLVNRGSNSNSSLTHII